MMHTKCDICNGDQHIERNCPSVHYIPQKLNVIKKIKAAKNDFERRGKQINDIIKNQVVLKEFREDFAKIFEDQPSYMTQSDELDEI